MRVAGRPGRASPDYHGAVALVDRRPRGVLARALGLRRRGRRRAASARWSTATGCRARAGFPDARAQLRREPAAPAATTRRRARLPRRGQGRARGSRMRELVDERVAPRRGAARAGVGPGDRVAGYLPNMPEAIIAMLATASLGAIWSSCSPDFGVAGRARPLRPDRAQGAVHRRRLPLQRQAASTLADKVAAIVAELPQPCERVVVVPYLGERPARPPASPPCAASSRWDDFIAAASGAADRASRSCRSTIRSTSCTRRARPACRSASSTAPAARCCSTSRSSCCTAT